MYKIKAFFFLILPLYVDVVIDESSKNVKFDCQNKKSNRYFNNQLITIPFGRVWRDSRTKRNIHLLRYTLLQLLSVNNI